MVIPYAHSNVVYGTGAARPWEDHARYLDALDHALAQRDTSMPTIVLGDNGSIAAAHQSRSRCVVDSATPCGTSES